MSLTLTIASKSRPFFPVRAHLEATTVERLHESFGPTTLAFARHMKSVQHGAQGIFAALRLPALARGV